MLLLTRSHMNDVMAKISNVYICNINAIFVFEQFFALFILEATKISFN